MTYNDLKHTHTKLGILLYRLSYPEKNSVEYWLKWSNRPLHEFVFSLLRGLNEHQIRIFRLQQEQDFIREQYQQLDNQSMLEEDREKIRLFFHRENLSLLRAEQLELNAMQEFVEEQQALIQGAIDNLDLEEAKAWKKLLREQYQNTLEELRRLGREKDMKAFKQEFSDKI